MNSKPNQVAIVTGASYGIGKATAIALAQEGYSVFITDIDKKALMDTKTTIETFNKNVFIADLDIRNLQQINRVIDDASEIGRLYLLVNNA